jgi:hypothetical protein
LIFNPLLDEDDLNNHHLFSCIKCFAPFDSYHPQKPSSRTGEVVESLSLDCSTRRYFSTLHNFLFPSISTVLDSLNSTRLDSIRQRIAATIRQADCHLLPAVQSGFNHRSLIVLKT